MGRQGRQGDGAGAAGRHGPVDEGSRGQDRGADQPQSVQGHGLAQGEAGEDQVAPQDEGQSRKRQASSKAWGCAPQSGHEALGRLDEKIGPGPGQGEKRTRHGPEDQGDKQAEPDPRAPLLRAPPQGLSNPPSLHGGHAVSPDGEDGGTLFVNKTFEVCGKRNRAWLWNIGATEL